MAYPQEPETDAGRSRLQHELKNPLAIILGRTHLLGRLLREHPGLTAPEHARVLATMQSIEQEVQVLAARIDAVQTVTYGDRE